MRSAHTIAARTRPSSRCTMPACVGVTLWFRQLAQAQGLCGRRDHSTVVRRSGARRPGGGARDAAASGDLQSGTEGAWGASGAALGRVAARCGDGAATDGKRRRCNGVESGRTAMPPARRAYLECFRPVLERCGPNVRPKRFGQTALHEVAAMGGHVTADDVVEFAAALLDGGARLDVRDE
jgi:hypothetical protein